MSDGVISSVPVCSDPAPAHLVTCTWHTSHLTLCCGGAASAGAGEVPAAAVWEEEERNIQTGMKTQLKLRISAVPLQPSPAQLSQALPAQPRPA